MRLNVCWPALGTISATAIANQSSVTADDAPGSLSSSGYPPTDMRAIGIGSAAEITRFELNPSTDRSNSAMVAGHLLRTFADAS